MNEKDLKFLTGCPYLARAKVYGLECAGVKFIDSRNVYIGENVKVGAGTLIWPNVYLLGDTKIGENCEIGPNVTLENAVIGNNTKIHQGCYISYSRIGDHCTVWIHASMFHAELDQHVIVHRDTRLVWSKVKTGTNLEASCQIKYADIGKNCRICHSVIEGEKFDENILISGKRSVTIGDSCVIGPWAYIHGTLAISPETKIDYGEITKSTA